MDTTDCGPDQNSRKRKLAACINSNQPGNIIYVPGVCLLHQYHLICQMSLKFVDSCLQSASYFTPGNGSVPESVPDITKYFASLAAIANTWREKASVVMTEWEHLYGPERKGRQFPQHVLQGRWGSVDCAERFYLDRGREKIQECLLKVIAKYIRADGSKSQSAEDGTDAGENGGQQIELADQDEVKSYKLRLSKWFSTTFRALNSKIFWFLLHVNHKIRSPLRHFLHFTQKYSTPRSSEHILLLLVERIDSFRMEWVLLLLDASNWIQEALQASGCNSLAPNVQGKLKVLVGQLLFKTGNGFDTRILNRLAQNLAICLAMFWFYSQLLGR